MSHKIDQSKGFSAFVSFAAPAWHNLGTVFQNAITTEDALKQGGLDFPVIKLPNIHLLPDGRELISEDSFFTIRTDVNKILGSRLGKDYEVMQNAEALNIVDEILQKGTATIETAGAIDNGRKVFICLKVAKDIVVGTDDKVNQYVLIATSHDGSLSITAMPTNIRVVCNNTLTAALGKSQDKIKIRHTSRASDRLADAMRVMKLMSDNTSKNEDYYNTMKSTRITREQMLDYFGNVFCTPVEIKELQSGKQAKEVLSSRKINILSDVLDFAQRGQGQSLTMLGSEFTLWSAYNAVTGYVTRKKYSTADDRANSMLFGSAAETIHEAGVLAMDVTSIKPCRKTKFDNLSLN